MRVATIVPVVVVVAALASPASATLTTVTRFSPANGRDVGFAVYTPPGYTANPTRRYPTVFSLHGIGGRFQDRANMAAPTLDAAINAGEIVPMIWVFPDGQENSFYGDAFDGHKQVHSNVIGEVLPYVDATYRTINHRDGRAIEGFSMGGFGAAMYGAKHPELFSAIVESGGALSTWQNLTQFNGAVAEEMYDTVETNWLPYSLWDVSAANAAALRTQVNYLMLVGDADGQQASNERFRDYLNSLNVFPQYGVLPGVQHLGGQYFNEGSGLAFLSEHFAAVPEPAGVLFTGALVSFLVLRRLPQPLLQLQGQHANRTGLDREFQGPATSQGTHRAVRTRGD